jgi:hypothetical protein
MGRVDGFEADECSFKYEIRSEPLLSGVWFWLFSLVFHLYTAPLFFPIFVRLVQRSVINNNTFAVKKKYGNKNDRIYKEDKIC